MSCVERNISESELLLRYTSGQRRFCDLDITSDGSNSLVGANLEGIELVGCFVSVSFREACLKDAVIHSNVKTCDFSNADLTRANFRTSALCAATFVGADMSDSDFTDAYFHGHVLKKGEQPDW
jgi:uncharacterized protein YjbI with pentapeptide repeats